MNGPTPEVWALVEFWRAALDFVIWWILAPYVGICVVVALLASLPERKN